MLAGTGGYLWSDIAVAQSAADDEAKHLERSWFFVQRLVRPTSTILVEPAPGRPWEPLEAARLEALASRTVQRRAAA